MCFICTLLDKSFPTPKQLAKAYFETTLTGVDDKDHYLDIEKKMEDEIGKQNLSQEAFFAYHKEFSEEYDRLKGQSW